MARVKMAVRNIKEAVFPPGTELRRSDNAEELLESRESQIPSPSASGGVEVAFRGS